MNKPKTVKNKSRVDKETAKKKFAIEFLSLAKFLSQKHKQLLFKLSQT